MKTAYLYRIDHNRNSAFVAAVSVPAETFQDIARNYKTAWLADNGYDPACYYLRAAPRIETTQAERQALINAERRLKAQGKLPSAFDAIAAKLSRK